MARAKKAASRGRGGGRGSRGGGRGGNRSSHNARSSDYDMDSDFVPFSGAPSHGFSLQAEALNTQRHESHWSSTSKLRYSKVSFVSAGSSNPSEQQVEEKETLAEENAPEEQSQKNNEGAMAGMSLKDNDKQVDEMSAAEKVQPEYHVMSDDLLGDIEAMLDASFVVDTQGAQPILTGLPAPRVRSPSPALTDSSEEVILFGGRDSTGRAIRRASPIRTAKSFRRIVQDEVTISVKPSTETSQPNVSIKAAKIVSSSNRVSNKLPPKKAVATEEDTKPVPENKPQDHLSGKSTKKTLEDELMADYIENIREWGLDPSALYKPRELGGTESEGELEDDENNYADGQFEDSDRDIPSDFGDMSTSDGVEGIVEDILSMRTRKSGLQYLLVWEGQEMHEAKWVPENALLAEQAKDKIAKYHQEEKLMAEVLCTDSEDDDEDDEDEEDSDDDEAISRDKAHIDSLSDAQIARLLAKQEELGMGSDDLMIFDGLGDEDMGDVDMGFLPARLSRRKPRISKKDGTPRNSKGEYPSATLTADAYDGFDVMDFERPSISVKKRTKKNKKPQFDISDSELERSLEDAWDLDRMKKSQKKKEREELRSQGLLGKNGGKADMKQKYNEGMGIDSVKEELKQFLQGSNTTLALPPMDKSFRKMIHEIANAFNLKSKSQGKGSSRFPVLIRTQRTMVYSENVFMGAQRRMGGRFLPRSDKSFKLSKTTTRVGFKSGGGGNSYRDGDVVGESAPELGVENRGRAMLEKMGWSSGTALGALNNKGILQPVSQVVKTSKAGLG